MPPTATVVGGYSIKNIDMAQKKTAKETRPVKTKKYQILGATPGYTFHPGMIVELPEAVAEKFLASKVAQLYTGNKKPEVAIAKPIGKQTR